jgi:hypothetical protein
MTVSTERTRGISASGMVKKSRSRVVADLDEAPLANGDRPGHPVALVHGVDAAVHQDQVAGLFSGLAQAARLAGAGDAGTEPASGDCGHAGERAGLEDIAARHARAVAALFHGISLLRSLIREEPRETYETYF